MKKMKTPLVAIIVLLAFPVSNTCAAERKPFGIGVIAGKPTGITAKLMVNSIHGIDAGIGWETSGDDEFIIYGDYLYHIYDLMDVSKGQLPLYFGAGLRYLDRDTKEDKLGVRIPAGIEYLFESLPLEAFIELVPVLNLSPDTDFDLEGGIGIRFLF